MEEELPEPALVSASAPDSEVAPDSAPVPVAAPPPAPLIPNIRGPRRKDLAPGFKRFVCKIAYDGTAFFGWQSQASGKTIQDALEKRLAEIFGTPTRIHGSGRTDAGVHASAQVFHFDAVWKHRPETLANALRKGFPAGISVFEVKLGRADFHARFSARGKRYCYHIYEGYAPPTLSRFSHSTCENKLNVPAMQATAKMLLGIHDFTAFSGRVRESENPVKDLRRLDVVRRGPRIDITTEASGYLYKMVRRLAGGLMQVGVGKMTPEELLAYLEARQSNATVPAAPARGLFLEKVFYRLPANAAPVFRQKIPCPDKRNAYKGESS
jgi:tRNA pseudouridine38-40 synthase